MRIFVSFVLSPGFFPFLDFRSDYEFVGAGDFLSILSEIERNYLYVIHCVVFHLRPLALARPARVSEREGVRMTGQEGADCFAFVCCEQIGRRQGCCVER